MKDKRTITLDEQELVVNFIPCEMGSDCEVYTTIPYMMKYLDKLVTDHPDVCKIIKDDQYSLTVRMPFKLCKPHAPRNISPEQRKANTERIIAARIARTVQTPVENDGLWAPNDY